MYQCVLRSQCNFGLDEYNLELSIIDENRSLLTVVSIQNYTCSYSYRKGDKSILAAGYLEALPRLKGGGILERPFDIWTGSATNPTCEDRGISGLDSDGGQRLEN